MSRVACLSRTITSHGRVTRDMTDLTEVSLVSQPSGVPNNAHIYMRRVCVLRVRKKELKMANDKWISNRTICATQPLYVCARRHLPACRSQPTPFTTYSAINVMTPCSVHESQWTGSAYMALKMRVYVRDAWQYDLAHCKIQHYSHPPNCVAECVWKWRTRVE